jgi:hypothetical protein
MPSAFALNSMVIIGFILRLTLRLNAIVTILPVLEYCLQYNYFTLHPYFTGSRTQEGILRFVHFAKCIFSPM